MRATNLTIPKGKLADESNETNNNSERPSNAKLAEMLRKGQPVKISQKGNVKGNDGEESNIKIPKGKLASDNNESESENSNNNQRPSNAKLAEMLRKGQPVKISQKGNVKGNDGEESNIKIPKGKLALQQWYDNDPELLEGEKKAMEKAFPYFNLFKLPDGRLAWQGELQIGVLGDNKWEVAAVYNNNHPEARMGSSVKVFLMNPSIDDLIANTGWRPTHLLNSEDGVYLCTANAEDIRTGNLVTTAASVLAWAVKWLMAFELVLTGDLTQEEFNRHNGI